MLAIQFFAQRSPGELLAVDPRLSRAALATSMGAMALVSPQEARGLGQFDVVVEMAGVATSALAAVRLARKGAGHRAGRHSRRPGPRHPARGDRRRHLSVRGVFGASSKAWAHAVRAFNSGVLTLRPLITHELPLEDYGTAMNLLCDPATGKILADPQPVPLRCPRRGGEGTGRTGARHRDCRNYSESFGINSAPISLAVSARL